MNTQLLHRKFWFKAHRIVNSIAHRLVPPKLKYPGEYDTIYEYNNDHWLWRLNKYCASKWLKYYSVCGDYDGLN